MCFLYFQNGMNAVSMRVAESYVDAFSNLAKTSNTVLLPTNTGDVSSMVAQVSEHRPLKLQTVRWAASWFTAKKISTLVQQERLSKLKLLVRIVSPNLTRATHGSFA